MRCRHVLSIDMLPDDILLAIFEFCAEEYAYSKEEIEVWWQTLVHVCRRWRTLVFESPRHLNLRLACAQGTTARDTLDVWPTLPLVVSTYDYETKGRMVDMVAVLKHSHRVCQIRLLNLTGSEMEKVYAAMQVPFPELTDLVLSLEPTGDLAVAPDSFLGGSAPLLRDLVLFSIPFPSLPKLLLSTSHIANLDLSKIPHSGYFSPPLSSPHSPCAPASDILFLHSNPPDLALSGQDDLHPRNVLLFPFSHICLSGGPASTLRTL